GTTYDLNTGSNYTGWKADGTNYNVTKVVFDPSFANVRPTTTNGWFYGMENLLSITGMSYLNTSEVTNMAWMFAHCYRLNSLDLSSFNTSKVTAMFCMFISCNSLTSLDLSSFNTSQVTNMDSMFEGCSYLQTITVGSGWTTAAVTSSTDMFKNCTSLVGGQGTTYNASHVDKAYAHIDGGTSNPGYFTRDSNEPEAYACYTPGNTTLTFYYDNQRSSRTGLTYDLNTGNNDTGWDTDGTNVNVTKVVFDPSFAGARPTTTYSWFDGMTNLQSITGMSYLNTSEVTNMAYMFGSSEKLTSLDLSSFNTSKVTNMSYMFDGCSGLKSLDLSYFNTSYVTDMRNMFSGCSGLKSLNLSGFDTYRVTDMYSMFGDCSSLTSLDLGSFNTSDVTDMADMFFGCSNLQHIYAGVGWSTASVTNSYYMFLGCSSLMGGKGTIYDANHVNAAYAHIDGGASNPGYLTATGTQAYACYTSSYTTTHKTLTFYYDNLRSSRPGTTYNMPGLNAPGWYSDGTNANVTQVVFDPSFAGYRPTYTYSWFTSMYKLQTIMGIEYLNTENVVDMRYMFQYCPALTSLDVSHFNTSRVTNMNAMFDNCSGLTSLDLSSFSTSNVTNMARMFTTCLNLTAIYVGEGWSTAAVTNSTDMFKTCTSLVGGQGTTYDANHVDKTYAHIDGGPSNPGYFTVEGTEAYACYSPISTTLTFYYDNQRSSRPGTTYDLNTGISNPGWYSDNTYRNVTLVKFDASFANARPTSTHEWFYGMNYLLSIWGINNLNTSKVTNMSYMFFGCSLLPSIDLSSFNTANVTDMRYMFCSCNGLESLDLSSFNTSKVTDMSDMFFLCGNLQTITVGSDWSTAAVTSSTNMFGSCPSLVGGQGTTYDANHVDVAYAHIDGGTSNPGYFTATGTEAYACYTPSNTTLTFYHDDQRSSRPGTTYDLNTGEHDAGWKTDGTNASVTRVVFDPSFAGVRPTTTYSWFYLMRNLQTITGIEYLNTSEVTNMAHMFNSCSKLTSIDLSSFNTSKVTEMRVMFCNCTGLTSLDLSSFNTSKVTNMFNMFGGCSSLTSLDLSSFNTSNVTDMGRLFYDCSRLTTVYVGEDWSTEAVTSSSYMFHNNNNLMGGQGTTYNGSNPKDKTYAHIDGGSSDPGYFTAAGIEAYACYTSENTTLTFYYDTERGSRPGTTYDLNTGMNTPAWRSVGSHVTQVVFEPSFANARPTTTYSWFYGMQNIQTIEGMEYLNTSEVTDIAYMFGWCTSLTSLDLSHFNTSKVTNMGYMFYYCESLTSLDLSSFITSMVTNTGFMFYGCSNLRTIYASEGWSTAAVTSSSMMFYGCTSLVGGQGTTYDASHIDKAYAHIDGGASNPGYFTDKNASLRGDVNCDGSVNIADVTALIDLLLGGSTISNPVADCNLDGTVNIADVTALIDYLLSGTW
ncbi:MAG: BspA family leucine-rich repeat surface protein, partial [Muribaculaceae bacterium]|nr:BspA family leucine-rich repeat surface protein [Muribaculaceae bacterium]